MRVADYKDLRVYKLAFESAMEIFELSRCGSGCEVREMPEKYFVGASDAESIQGSERESVEPQLMTYVPRSRRSLRSPRSPRSPRSKRP